ncbi:hypothetical protein NMG29_20470 [Streptomyces cocklensis]|uniref:Uncharacterized protein n=1 Tax=Actinacidiphila cocklensis TaxID=887465 RepID=A0A9W4DUU3_9ACTN|nr:hypothetical protein [Actinacidiphila cocklensis]MDD1060552.1 hypothetical protein [Actinacidiphila cocklensis]CAG6393955.1 conserved hypothetical protein [Actinacidiphila cocklensis]
MTDLPERLRNAADAHRPDRERMLARVEHAMAADGAGSGRHEPGARGHDRPPAAPWMRVTAVTAAVAGAIGIGGLAVGAVTGDGRPAGTVVTSGGSSSPAPPPATASGTPGSADTRAPVPRHSTAVSGHRGSTSTPRSTAGRTPPAAPSTQSPPTHAQGTPAVPPAPPDGTQPPASSGPLQSNGGIAASSNDYWTQSDVELTTTQTLTSLTVELRIAVSNGEASTGSWSSVPDRTAAQVSVEGKTLVYRWTLNAGQTLGPGSYTFSGQFNHDQGQGGTDGDRYTVTAGYGSGATATVSGGF